jgi:hypothetical protein
MVVNASLSYAKEGAACFYRAAPSLPAKFRPHTEIEIRWDAVVNKVLENLKNLAPKLHVTQRRIDELIRQFEGKECGPSLRYFYTELKPWVNTGFMLSGG